MSEVTFVSNDGESMTVSAREGGSLVDLCDDVGAPVPFGCRGATCGTCRVVVLEGAEELSAPQQDEKELLAIFASPPSHRLACQAVMRAGGGRLVLRPVRDDE